MRPKGAILLLISMTHCLCNSVHDGWLCIPSARTAALSRQRAGHLSSTQKGVLPLLADSWIREAKDTDL